VRLFDTTISLGKDDLLAFIGVVSSNRGGTVHRALRAQHLGSGTSAAYLSAEMQKDAL
jgi:hypothetical protein